MVDRRYRCLLRDTPAQTAMGNRRTCAFLRAFLAEARRRGRCHDVFRMHSARHFGGGVALSPSLAYFVPPTVVGRRAGTKLTTQPQVRDAAHETRDNRVSLHPRRNANSPQNQGLRHVAVMYPKVSGLPLVIRPCAPMRQCRVFTRAALSTLIFSGRRWTLELC